MKKGANFTDRNRIKAMVADKKTLEEISKTLLIDESVVKKFMKDKPVAKPAEKPSEK